MELMAALQMHPPQRRDRLSAYDAMSLYAAPRPRTAGYIESRPLTSSIPSTVYTSYSNDTKRTRRSSTNAYSSAIAKVNYDIPRLTKTPREMERNRRRNSIWRRTRAPDAGGFSSNVFKKLPREVYDCIVKQLEQMHLAQDESCPSCYLRDLRSLSLTSRAWDRAATLSMYRRVWVQTNNDHPRMPKLKLLGTSRIKLLRRTLRERPTLARYVRELHLSDFQAMYQNASIEKEEIVNSIASLVMVCPNLERLVGFHVPYTHSFDRLSYALSTRRNLKERVWLLRESTGLEPDEEEEDEDLSNGYYHAAIDPMERFLELNSSQPNLTTLVLHQQQSRLSHPLTFRAMVGTFRKCPSLRHLSISGLPASSFTNLALNALPPYLQSLRLENLPGINDKGLQRFANSYIPTSLERLTLINLEIGDLSILSALFSPHLPNLKRFTLAQHRAPLLPSFSPTDDIPTLNSSKLQFIHWELRSQAAPPPTLLSPFGIRDPSGPQFPFQNSEPIACLATSLLATSIKIGGFPSLTRLRAPHDPQGLLQALCRPRATALLPSDSSLLTNRPRPPMTPPRSPTRAGFDADLSAAVSKKLRKSKSAANISDRVDSAMSSPMSSEFPFHTSQQTSHLAATPLATSSSTPAHSRLLAQSRILSARKTPFIHVKVIDPAGNLHVSKPTLSFMGQLESKIEYDMRPDSSRLAAEGEGNQWITGIADVVGDMEVSGASDTVLRCKHGRSRKKMAVRVEEMF